MVPFTAKYSSTVKSTEDALEQYIYGKNSRFSKLKDSGNIQCLGRFLVATGDVLNTAGREIETSKKVKLDREKKRRKV